MKKLPSVYPVPMEKKITNNNEMYYSKDKDLKMIRDGNHALTLTSKINRIFNAPDFIYKKTVKIITNKGIFEKTIIGKKSGYLLTDTNEAININDIIDIQ